MFSFLSGTPTPKKSKTPTPKKSKTPTPKRRTPTPKKSPSTKSTYTNETIYDSSKLNKDYIENIMDETCKEIPDIMTNGKVIGEGTEGFIYIKCILDDCSYVLKLFKHFSDKY